MVRMNRSETKVIANGDDIGRAWKDGYGKEVDKIQVIRSKDMNAVNTLSEAIELAEEMRGLVIADMQSIKDPQALIRLESLIESSGV